MNQVQIGGYTFVSDAKDSTTVTVIGGGQCREMYRDQAVALFKELRLQDTVVHVPQAKRQAWVGTNPLRHK